jgi:putative transposase
VLYTYKFELLLKTLQSIFLNKQIGSCRFIFNKLLEIANEEKQYNYYELKKRIVNLKKEYSFLKEVNSQSLQEACLNLKRAFDNFLKKELKHQNLKVKDIKIQ